ncbi:zinc-dependent alcohol dehydrogenase family protein [Peribacillus sp. NPDC097675]|uniref:zinc-dependent alcohol dehydrogenase family protein n=1 Tax=Peribacillus sp. NPDC097675 TaxID=3390618 RepID=UPI003D04121F
MRALLLEETNKPMEVKQVTDPSLTNEGVIVKVMANGICRSDWHVWMGDTNVVKKYPHVLGHEFTGVIEEVGKDVKKFKKGDRVIVPVAQGDNTCPYCLGGHQNLCVNRVIPGVNYWGGYSEYAHVPNADGNLIPLPDSLDFVSAASLGCRFVTAYHGIVDQVKVQAGEWVVIQGCGGVGLSAIQIASSIGAKVIAVDIGADKLEMAKQLGAHITVNGSLHDPVEAVLEITKGGANVSVDALGISDTCQKGILSLGKRGRHLQIGLTTKKENGFISVPIDMIVGKEIQIIGSSGMPTSRYSSMFQLIESVNIKPGDLVTERVSLDQAFDVIAGMSHYANTGISVVDRF